MEKLAVLPSAALVLVGCFVITGAVTVAALLNRTVVSPVGYIWG